MTDNPTPLATLIERAEEYSKSTIELFKLNAIDKSADTLSSIVSKLVIIMTVVLSVLIINIGLALWIGKELGESFYGFFVIGFFYAFVAIMLQIFRRQWLKYPISNSLIEQMLKRKHHEN
ncbi:MAG: hypothetical protein ABI426_02565 [Flavobacterium sp.]